MGLKNYHVTLWQEIPPQERVKTREHCQSVEGVDVLPTVEREHCGKDDPGEDQQEQAEGY